MIPSNTFKDRPASFATPEALARHLAQSISDPAFILDAVRKRFPDYQRDTRRRR